MSNSQRRSISWRDATQIATTTIQVLDSASGTVLSVPLVANVPGGIRTGDGSLYAQRTDHWQLLLHWIEHGGGNRAELSSAADCGIAQSDGHGGDRVPGYEHCVQCSGSCPAGTPPPSTPTATPTATVSPTTNAKRDAGKSDTNAERDAVRSSTPTPSASPAPVSKAINLSTRMRVQTGDNVGIGGFIITGNAPKKVIVRAIGPSLTRYGITDPLLDPVLELHGPGGFTTVINNNWRDTQEDEIQATGIPPINDLESAILATLFRERIPRS